MKYFIGCSDVGEARKRYLELMKKYHPDLARDVAEAENNTDICKEINDEYERVTKILPKASKTSNDSLKELISCGSESARSAYNEVMDRILELNVDDEKHPIWLQREITMLMEDTVNLFWNLCLSKKIVGEEFAKLFELCGNNAEKMKRVVMFLSTGALSDRDIHVNLTSDNPIPFFDDSITVDNLPDYNHFLLLSRESTKREVKEAWVEFCGLQRDNFLEKYYDIAVKRIPEGKQK